MDNAPYINAMVAIVLIVSIVFFTDVYVHEDQSSEIILLEQNSGPINSLSSITGNVVATQQGFVEVEPCYCIQRKPYQKGPLSFVIRTTRQQCTADVCQENSREEGLYFIAKTA